jgi:hypothetical protein
MPWIRKGRTIYKRVDGLKKKQTAKSVKRAKGAMRLLHGIEHGMVPRKR